VLVDLIWSCRGTTFHAPTIGTRPRNTSGLLYQSPHREDPSRQDSLLEIGGNSRRNLLGDAVSRLGSMFCSVLECITKCNKYRKLNDAFAFS
jgi:hypothetical protein